MRKVELNKENFNSLPEYKLEDITQNGLQVGDRYLTLQGHYEILSIEDGVISRMVKIRYITTGIEGTVDYDTLVKDTLERYNKDIKIETERHSPKVKVKKVEVKKEMSEMSFYKKGKNFNPNDGFLDLNNKDHCRVLGKFAKNCTINVHGVESGIQSFTKKYEKITGESPDENYIGVDADILRTGNKGPWGAEISLHITKKVHDLCVSCGLFGEPIGFRPRITEDGADSNPLCYHLFFLGFRLGIKHNIEKIRKNILEKHGQGCLDAFDEGYNEKDGLVI